MSMNTCIQRTYWAYAVFGPRGGLAGIGTTPNKAWADAYENPSPAWNARWITAENGYRVARVQLVPPYGWDGGDGLSEAVPTEDAGDGTDLTERAASVGAGRD